MILNHKAAIEMLVDQAQEIGFDRYTVQNLHALLADNLLPEAAAGGRIRHTEVGIGNSVFHPLAIPQQIEEYFDLLLGKAAAIEDPFEQAFFVMAQLPYLQPFDDVNKRASRLAANIPLIKQNLAPLSFVDVPRDEYIEGTLGVYELNRIELLRDVFVWAYERSCRRFTVIRDVLPEPDQLRLRYRELLQQVIGDIVTAGVRRMRSRRASYGSARPLNCGVIRPGHAVHLTVFDVDGTLVDSDEFDGQLYAAAVRDVLGVEVDCRCAMEAVLYCAQPA